LLVVGSLYHVGAFDLSGIAVVPRAALHSPQFRTRQALAAIENEKLSAAWFAPVMTTAPLTYPGGDRYGVSSLRGAIGGERKTPEGRIRAISEFFKSALYIDYIDATAGPEPSAFMEPGRGVREIGRRDALSPGFLQRSRFGLGMLAGQPFARFQLLQGHGGCGAAAQYCQQGMDQLI
jgi:fatty-acyl-CoA synthase